MGQNKQVPIPRLGTWHLQANLQVKQTRCSLSLRDFRDRAAKPSHQCTYIARYLIASSLANHLANLNPRVCKVEWFSQTVVHTTGNCQCVCVNSFFFQEQPGTAVQTVSNQCNQMSATHNRPAFQLACDNAALNSFHIKPCDILCHTEPTLEAVNDGADRTTAAVATMYSCTQCVRVTESRMCNWQ